MSGNEEARIGEMAIEQAAFDEADANWLPIAYDPDYRPLLRPDLLIDHIDTEAIVWNPAMPDPTYLDPVAVLLTQVFDGEATATELADDISDAFEVTTDLAIGQVQRVLQLLAKDDLLVRPDGQVDLRLPKRSLLPDPDW